VNREKQALLKHHRQKNRGKLIALLLALLFFELLDFSFGWEWLSPVALLIWLAHEAWFSDHQFYSPKTDYRYRFPEDALCLPLSFKNGGLHCPKLDLDGSETLIVQVRLKARLLGWLFDPGLVAGDNRQDFERGVHGLRYFNLSGQGEALLNGTLRLRCRFCRIIGELHLYAFKHPDYRQKRLLILAPHADDAELAAFGLYSRAKEVAIVTLTQGEIEAEQYRRFNLDKAGAAQLKGRLRTWNSLAVPLWGGVSQSHCVQLGYFCLQLTAMLASPEQAFGSRESDETDIRSARAHSPLKLPADNDGLPTGNNLLADLVALLEHFRPEVIVTPHPQIDAHSDHSATTKALMQALKQSTCQPQTLLLYANHLPDNDRWPMGRAGDGVSLPPHFDESEPLHPWSLSLDAAQQLNKSQALAMQHDLQTPLPFKKRLRRHIQYLLAARRWPNTGEDEFFRKAVRRHEMFFVQKLQAGEGS